VGCAGSARRESRRPYTSATAAQMWTPAATFVLNESGDTVPTVVQPQRDQLVSTVLQSALKFPNPAMGVIKKDSQHLYFAVRSRVAHGALSEQRVSQPAVHQYSQDAYKSVGLVPAFRAGSYSGYQTSRCRKKYPDGWEDLRGERRRHTRTKEIKGGAWPVSFYGPIYHSYVRYPTYRRVRPLNDPAYHPRDCGSTAEGEALV